SNCAHDNVEAFNMALFDKEAVLQFELSDENHGDHRIRVRDADGQWGERRRAVVDVVAGRLDDTLNWRDLKAPIAVKIDTQGAESQIISGGRSLLGRAEIISFEFWPYGIARAEGNADLLLNFISENFVIGAILSGDNDEPPIWRAIRDVAGDLKSAMAHRR